MMENSIGQDKLENPRSYDDDGSQPIANEVDENGAEPATEDEQMDYDLLTIRSRKMMFGKGREKILTMLGTAESPAQGLGKAASMLIKSLMESGKEAGRDIDPNTAIHAADEIIQDLSDLAKSAGVYTYDSEEEETKQLEDAMLYGVKAYGDGMVENGEITPEMQSMAGKQMQEGLAEEARVNGAPQPKSNPVGEAVNQGLVGNAMQAQNQSGSQSREGY